MNLPHIILKIFISYLRLYYIQSFYFFRFNGKKSDAGRGDFNIGESVEFILQMCVLKELLLKYLTQVYVCLVLFASRNFNTKQFIMTRRKSVSSVLVKPLGLYISSSAYKKKIRESYSKGELQFMRVIHLTNQRTCTVQTFRFHLIS